MDMLFASILLVLENASINVGVRSTIPVSFLFYSSHYPNDPAPRRNLQTGKLSSSHGYFPYALKL